jgi:glucans biosynthesis protein
MHGGAKGSGAPKSKKNGRYEHGIFTCEAIEQRREIRALIAEIQAVVEGILKSGQKAK